METIALRPKLKSFRATSFHGENNVSSSGQEPWNIELKQTIEVGLGAQSKTPSVLLAIVKIELDAKATKKNATDQVANFNASYEAKFEYPSQIKKEDIFPKFEQELYQYVLVAQAFPLALSHFRREMQSMGFDARNLPLGL
ncbi:MAG TPA: hypothetical protein PK702_11525 [Burkholderiaceae bacterium]|nr:hypothetical protein [Burkholderiaceae bacterium]